MLRAISAAETITDITTSIHLTQGANSQTVALMVTDGLVERHALQDGRKTGIRLTPYPISRRARASKNPHQRRVRLAALPTAAGRTPVAEELSAFVRSREGNPQVPPGRPARLALRRYVAGACRPRVRYTVGRDTENSSAKSLIE